MAVPNSVDPAAWLAEQIEHGDPDLLRSKESQWGSQEVWMTGGAGVK
ncbi:hypothetical protein GCM10017673_29180 [Streptosporangium violaceochromogenes]|nr:hypothetical protein GCM10017673_29180 [Streptosporangium violaceochromogenes]